MNKLRVVQRENPDRSSAPSHPTAVTERTNPVDVAPTGKRRLASVRQACAICGRPSNLRRTIGIAIVVGTILSAINQLDVLINGEATTLTWVKVALNFVVPFCVSNLGVVAGAKTTGAWSRQGSGRAAATFCSQSRRARSR